MESIFEFLIALFETPAMAWSDAQSYGHESYFAVPLILTVVIWVIIPVVGTCLLYRLCKTVYLIVRRRLRACRSCGNSYACCVCQADAVPDDERQVTLQIYH